MVSKPNIRRRACILKPWGWRRYVTNQSKQYLLAVGLDYYKTLVINGFMNVFKATKPNAGFWVVDVEVQQIISAKFESCIRKRFNLVLY